VQAIEDTNPSSGTISGATVGSVGSTGGISGGSLTGITVTGDMGGTIVAQGAGTISDICMGSLSGSVQAIEDNNPSSGTISGATVGSVGSTGSISGGSLTGITVTGDMGGTIVAQGAGTISDINIHGNLKGRVEAKVDSHAGSGKIGTLTAGKVDGKVIGKDIDLLSIAGSVGGSIKASGAIGQATINTVAAGGTVTSSSVNSLSVSNDAGTVSVTNTISSANIGTIAGTGSLAAGTLSSLKVSGAISGNLSADYVGTTDGENVSADGTTVFKITQAGVERRIVAIPVNGLTAMPGGVKFNYVYDGASGTNPQVAVRVTNGDPTTSADDVPFDLELITNSANEFDLARLDANGTSDIRNVVVQGNILSKVTADTASIFGLPAAAAGGVQLPLDNLNGVAAADNIRSGVIAAKTVQLVSFGSVTAGTVTTLAGSATNATARSTLAATTGLAQAKGTYVIPFSENQKVAAFLVTSSAASGFDASPVLLTDQIVDNQALTAVIKSTAPVGGNATIQSIDLVGSGGAIQTALWIQASISSTGPLGDLILSATQGITAHVTAPSIIGNIDAQGGISGVIETSSGDIGATLTDPTRTITGVTSIHSGGTFTGKIISRGNLVSSILIDGGMTGLIAAQKDIGAIQRNPDGSAVVGADVARSLTRFGGIRVNGGMGGQIVALGNIFGDLTFNGGIDGRIAVKGQQVAGLDAQRYGILGRVTINGTIGSSAAIASGGVIGDDGVYVGIDTDTTGTQITFGSDKGILAADSDINFGKTGKLPTTGVFENATGLNQAAIDALFTQGGAQLLFDTIISGKTGLDLILGDLAALKVSADGTTLTGTVA
jgi:hypothetical protein